MRRTALPILAVLVISGLLASIATPQAPPPSLQSSSGRDCATCHMTWIESFKRPGAVLLVDRPPETYVSASPNCLSCHDGSVGDARRRVWVDHGHKTGVAPQENMQVPKDLPLVDGKLACRTCHTAHAGTGPETLATTVFLRVQNDAGQLCTMCHVDYVKGPDQGSHPLGPMKIELPPVLKAAYAHAGKDNHTLNCQSCHTPHGQREDHLLVLPAANRELCLSCHTELAPDLWKEGRHHPHPQEAKLVTDAQRQTIRDLHTRTGPGDTLICLSCHKMHTAVPRTRILADTLENSALCLRCHAEQKPVLDTNHNLAKSSPQTVNLLKQSPATSGACSACHGVHQATRNTSPAPADPSGQCLTCHQSGQCAEKRTGQPVSHPIHPADGKLAADLALKLKAGFPDRAQKTIACLTCHNPHDGANGHFLRAKHDTLCATCHGEQATVAAGPHNFERHRDLKNARGMTAAEAGNCGFCHAIHDAKGPVLWAATNSPPENPADLCSGCHSAGGLAARHTPGALRHPSGPQTAAAVATMHPTLPLFDAKGHGVKDGFVSCSTCHNPHAGRGARALLRVEKDERPETLCVTCHADARPLQASLHGHDIVQHQIPDLFGRRDTACAPCHATHEKRGMAPTGMWSGPMAADQPPGIAECLGCHAQGGGATPIKPTIHPNVLMQNVAAQGSPGYMPLFDSEGREGMSGQITCRTCHLPHGRQDLMDVAADLLPVRKVADTHAGEKSVLDLSGLRALRPMVRPYESPNLCSGCHGLDGLRKYLYYHWPDQRPAVE